MFGKAAKLRQVVRQSAVPPQHAIYVGDEIRDAEAAGKAGIAFGAVLWGQHISFAFSVPITRSTFSRELELTTAN